MTAEYYTGDEKRIVHPDGWQVFVRDADDEGLIEIGQREFQDGKWVAVGGPIQVDIELVNPLAEVLQYFADRATK